MFVYNPQPDDIWKACSYGTGVSASASGFFPSVAASTKLYCLVTEEM
jgi:hypothetical protein